MAFCKRLSEQQKWVIALYISIAFLILASPVAFNITGYMTSAIGWESSQGGKPNLSGLVLHALLFSAVVRALMLVPSPDEKV